MGGHFCSFCQTFCRAPYNTKTTIWLLSPITLMFTQNHNFLLDGHNASLGELLNSYDARICIELFSWIFGRADWVYSLTFHWPRQYCGSSYEAIRCYEWLTREKPGRRINWSALASMAHIAQKRPWFISNRRRNDVSQGH